jgi:hypothetical protein
MIIEGREYLLARHYQLRTKIIFVWQSVDGG